MESDHPPMESEEEQLGRVAGGRWLRHVRDAFILGLLIHLGFIGGDEITRSRLPADSFWLAPRGWGFFWDAVTGVGVLTAFAVMYALPAFFVRRWIGLALRATMFLLFVVGLGFARAEKCVGAIQSPGSFEFVRTFPFSSTTLARSAISPVQVRDTGWVKAASIGRDDRALSLIPVWQSDRASLAELDRLVAALNRK